MPLVKSNKLLLCMAKTTRLLEPPKYMYSFVFISRSHEPQRTRRKTFANLDEVNAANLEQLSSVACVSLGDETHCFAFRMTLSCA